MSKKKADVNEIVAALAEHVGSAEDLAAAVKLLQKAALERMLEAEMTEHLGYEKHAAEGYDGGNSRNGAGSKTVTTDTGAVQIDVPRDREGTFEPKLIKKGQRRLKGFDEKLISLYARGLTVREIQGHIREIYDVEVSPDLISRVTDQVLEEVQAWQNRPLDAVYPLLFLDGFVVKVRKDRSVRNRTVYIALAVNMQGRKEVLGLWMADTEGAKFWLHVVNELRNRGVQDVLIASVDGLKGFPEALEAAFPRTIVQTCIVHMVRNSTHLVSWANRKAVARDLRTIYSSATEAEGLKQLEAFEATWDGLYPSIGKSWRSNWERVRPFFEFAPEIRKAIYTTNAIEALNRQLRKVTKTRGSFPTDAAVFKLLWLAIGKAQEKWTYPIQHWDLFLQQMAIAFEGRVPLDQYRNG